MRKFLILLFGLLLITGCTKQEEKVKTMIEKKYNTNITIQYPITNISKLDQIVKKDVKEKYQDFLEQQKEFVEIAKDAEFNIDYTYHQVDDHYEIITLRFFSNSTLLSNPLYEISTYVFDTKDHEMKTIKDLISSTETDKLQDKILKELQKKYPDCLLLDQVKKELSDISHLHFTFDHENFYFYFDPYEIAAGYFDIMEVSIPIEQIGLTIDLELGESKKTYQPVEKTTRIIDPDQKSIAITFDDGPSNYTNEILNVLKKYDASGTFFVIGNKVEIYSDTMRRMVREGNEIGNHSYSHKWLTKLDQEELKEQIQLTQDIVKKVTGVTPRLLRPTYGAVNDKLRNSTSLEVIMWDVDTRDWESHNIDTIVKKTIKNTKDGSIIIMHDTKKQTVNILEQLLKKLEKEDYQFVTVTELKKIKQMRAYEK